MYTAALLIEHLCLRGSCFLVRFGCHCELLRLFVGLALDSETACQSEFHSALSACFVSVEICFWRQVFAA